MKKIINYIKKMKCIILKYIFIFTKIQNNKVLFINYNGKGYGDNLKYIAQKIIDDNMPYDMVWVLNKNQKSEMPKKIRIVTNYSIKYLYEIATSKIIITNVKKSLFLIKKKKQYIIQTWHGSYSLKKVEKEAKKLPLLYVLQSKHNSKQTDIFLSNSKLQTEEYYNSFWGVKEVFESGYPRNDIFFDNNIESKIKQIKEKLKINNKKIVLYMPTFRDYNSLNPYDLDIKKVLETLNQKNEDDYIMIVKLHPNISEKKIFKTDNSVLDLSKYPDSQELLLISDALITDYSTCMFDFLLMKKTVFIFANDIVEYENSRGLKPIFYELPFNINETNEALIESIKNFDEEQYKKNIDAFLKKYSSYDDGNASKRVVNRINEVMEGK